MSNLLKKRNIFIFFSIFIIGFSTTIYAFTITSNTSVWIRVGTKYEDFFRNIRFNISDLEQMPVSGARIYIQEEPGKWLLYATSDENGIAIPEKPLVIGDKIDVRVICEGYKDARVEIVVKKGIGMQEENIVMEELSEGSTEPGGEQIPEYPSGQIPEYTTEQVSKNTTDERGRENNNTLIDNNNNNNNNNSNNNNNNNNNNNASNNKQNNKGTFRRNDGINSLFGFNKDAGLNNGLKENGLETDKDVSLAKYGYSNDNNIINIFILIAIMIVINIYLILKERYLKHKLDSLENEL